MTLAQTDARSNSALDTDQNTRMIRDVEEELFHQLGLAGRYEVNEIPMSGDEVMKTIHIKGNCDTKRVFYLGHGFGGTSLMYFPYFHQLLEKGSIVLWEIRGMGMNAKKDLYPEIPEAEVENFFDEGLMAVLKFYNHSKIVFISHSLGAYITIRFAIKYSKQFSIQRAILLSPIGFTRMEEDYKNRCETLGDLYHHALSWTAWKFNLTYKSVCRFIFHSLKVKFLRNWFSTFQLDQRDLHLYTRIFDVKTSLSGGSYGYFYKTFHPRVIPYKDCSIQEFLVEENPIQFVISIYYGGSSDWVDKKGAQYLSQKYSKIHVKEVSNCGHMLPLHSKAMRTLFSGELNNLK